MNPLSSAVEFASFLLLVNALWDLGFGLAKLWLAVTGGPGVDIHLRLFSNLDDRSNPAVALLTGTLQLHWAWTRFFAGVFFRFGCFDAAFTYVLQSVLLTMGILIERIEAQRGWMAAVNSLLCAGMVLGCWVVDGG